MKIVKRLLKDGVDKKEIFDRAVAEGLDAKKVAKHLALYPDPEESERYHKANKTLLIVYSVLTLFGMLAILPLLAGMPAGAMLVLLGFVLLIPVALIYSISKKQSIGYLVLSFFVLKGVVDSFTDTEGDVTAMAISMSVGVLFLTFVVCLKLRLFPHQNFINNKKDQDGLVIFTKDMVSTREAVPQDGSAP